jgi:hypothetical protein
MIDKLKGMGAGSVDQVIIENNVSTNWRMTIIYSRTIFDNKENIIFAYVFCFGWKYIKSKSY